MGEGMHEWVYLETKKKVRVLTFLGSYNHMKINSRDDCVYSTSNKSFQIFDKHEGQDSWYFQVKKTDNLYLSEVIPINGKM